MVGITQEQVNSLLFQTGFRINNEKCTLNEHLCTMHIEKKKKKTHIHDTLFLLERKFQLFMCGVVLL